MRARAVAAIALSGALALGLTGCNLWMEAETNRQYDPSDGINFDVGELQLRNILVISDDGETGALLGTAVNSTDTDIDFTFQWRSGDAWQQVELTAAAGGRTDFGFGDGERITLDGFDAVPGGLLEVAVSASGTQLGEQVPVLDASLVEYADLLPTPTPTPDPADTPTPDPAETAETPAP